MIGMHYYINEGQENKQRKQSQNHQLHIVILESQEAGQERGAPEGTGYVVGVEADGCQPVALDESVPHYTEQIDGKS